MTSSDLERPLREFFQKSRIALALARADGDNELALVNTLFTSLTGYDEEDVVGRNCRLLQESAKGIRADNAVAKDNIHEFLRSDGPATVRTPIVNFRKDGAPFVNLLFMSKLKSASGKVSYIFASQFDVSRTHAEMLDAYDQQLSRTLKGLQPLLEGHDVMVNGTLSTIANSTAVIAQAKLTLAELETNAPY